MVFPLLYMKKAIKKIAKVLDQIKNTRYNA